MIASLVTIIIACIAGITYYAPSAFGSNASAISIPAKPNYAPDSKYDTYMTGEVVNDVVAEYESGCMCHDCYHAEVFSDALSEFDALFNSYTYKVSKNGRSMVNGKFVKKG